MWRGFCSGRHQGHGCLRRVLGPFWIRGSHFALGNTWKVWGVPPEEGRGLGSFFRLELSGSPSSNCGTGSVFWPPLRFLASSHGRRLTDEHATVGFFLGFLSCAAGPRVEFGARPILFRGRQCPRDWGHPQRCFAPCREPCVFGIFYGPIHTVRCVTLILSKKKKPALGVLVGDGRTPVISGRLETFFHVAIEVPIAEMRNSRRGRGKVTSECGFSQKLL